MNESDNDNLEDLRYKKRSLVWQFFEKISRHRIRCRICQHEQNYQGTTGNILRHLKSKHDLDATLKGQQDEKNRLRIEELGGAMPPPVQMEIKMENVRHKKRERKTSDSDDMSNTDPYGDNQGDNQVAYESNNFFYENVGEFKEDCLEEDDHPFKFRDRKTKLEEDRVLAETEYFREKAAFFRFQKHLTALQAKKIKLEIEQLASMNKRNRDDSF